MRQQAQQILLWMHQLKFYKPTNLPVSSATELANQGYHSARHPSRNASRSFATEKSAVDTTVDLTFQKSKSGNKSSNQKKKQEQPSYSHVKKVLLTKILINRSLNLWHAIKQFQEIPSSLFLNSPKLDLAKPIIMKSKLTLETSLLRTLLYSFGQEQKQDESRLKVMTSINTFVIATQSQEKAGKRQTVLLLSQLLKQHVRNCIREFRINRQQKDALRVYLTKMKKNIQQSHLIALNTIKNLPERTKSIERATFILTRLVSILQKDQHRQLIIKSDALSKIKMQSLIVGLERRSIAKLVLSFSKIRREQAFLIWQDSSYDCRVEQQQPVKIKEVSSEQIAALRKIVNRNYLKLFRQILRRFENYRRVATAIASRSRINEQKALWRLHIHLQSSHKK